MGGCGEGRGGARRGEEEEKKKEKKKKKGEISNDKVSLYLLGEKKGRGGWGVGGGGGVEEEKISNDKVSLYLFNRRSSPSPEPSAHPPQLTHPPT